MGRIYLKVSVVYFSIGVLLGLTMGIIHDFRLTSVHAHLNLLGWVSMALFGLIYHFYPSAANTQIAKLQFWLHNIGVPVMMTAIGIQIWTGEATLVSVAVIGSILVVIGVLLFALNLFKQVDS
ncbi:cytochrome-c oxidase [Domibacillus epiphyticus]|uniref:Cytochrome-c oxidase n=1 Tax=Domibacillus epiphyticus TaxID=1714355 RepID=A0A1V2A8C0_9BACI|nr:cytochrome-c oxidase [Domibacillus epiphyticus]OMP67197.1 cytochrome-c oxidase [Domibacillus epiphyticus]